MRQIFFIASLLPFKSLPSIIDDFLDIRCDTKKIILGRYPEEAAPASSGFFFEPSGV
jgi:hypothetical protein